MKTKDLLLALKKLLSKSEGGYTRMNNLRAVFKVPKRDKALFKTRIHQLVDQGWLFKDHKKRYFMGEIMEEPGGIEAHFAREYDKHKANSNRKKRQDDQDTLVDANHPRSVSDFEAKPESKDKSQKLESDLPPSLQGKVPQKEVSEKPEKDKKTKTKKPQLQRGQLLFKGKMFWVIDAEDAKKRYRIHRPDRNLRSGQKVSFRLEKGEKGYIARIAQDPKLNKLSLDDLKTAFLAKHNLSRSYPPQAFDVVRNVEIPTGAALLKDRVDYRSKTTICIDPLGARDHDDAISLVETDIGWELGVHIADVSHFVPEGSALDYEAWDRAFTQYLPWEAIPMLPEKLATDLCSLRQGVDRMAFSCIMQMTETGDIKSFEFCNTVVNVDRFLTYEEAIEEEKAGDENLSNLAKLTATLRNNRREDGLLELNLPERKVKFDDEGEPVKIEKRDSIISQTWIEECMLSANVCCAKFMTRNKLAGLYRTHEAPQADSVRSLATNDPELFRGLPMQSIFKDLAGDSPNVNPQRFELYRELVERSRDNDDILRKVLRSMEKARYDATPDGHFALNWKDYAHFTSPIRRYADLWCHRRIKEALKNQVPEGKEELGRKVAESISGSEIEIMKCERKGFRFCTARIAQEFIGDDFNGTIVGMESFGMFIELDAIGVDGLLRYADLKGDYFEYDPGTDRLVGRKSGLVYKKGDEMKVNLFRADPVAGEVDLLPTEDWNPKANRGPRSKRRRK